MLVGNTPVGVSTNWCISTGVSSITPGVCVGVSPISTESLTPGVSETPISTPSNCVGVSLGVLVGVSVGVFAWSFSYGVTKY